MKNPFKHELTSNGQPSQHRSLPTSPAVRDLTDADLKQVQGGADKAQQAATEKQYIKITQTDATISS